MAQVDLLPHLPKREKSWLLGWRVEAAEPEYVVLDRKGNKWPLRDDEYADLFARLMSRSDYVLVAAEDEYYVFRRIRRAG